jgi:hypothetical protein
MTEPKPVTETKFLQDELVICGKCKGHKVVETFLKNIRPCPLCLGEGMLHKVTEGSVKLYLIS